MGLLDTLFGTRQPVGINPNAPAPQVGRGGLLSMPGQIVGGLLGGAIQPIQRGIWGVSDADLMAQRRKLLEQQQAEAEQMRQFRDMQMGAFRDRQAQEQQDRQASATILGQLTGRSPEAFTATDPLMVAPQARRIMPGELSPGSAGSPGVGQQAALATALSNPGAVQGNPMLANLLMPKEAGAKFGNVNPGDFTPASLAKYEKTRNFADLVLKPTAGQQPPSGYTWGPNGTLRPIPGGPADPTSPSNIRKNMEGATGLRKEFEGMDPVKNYRAVLTQYQRASEAPNTRAGDLSVVYALGKIFDPASVVREGELQLSKDAQPWMSKIVNEAQSQIRGTGALDPATRKNMLDAMRGQVDAMAQSYAQERQRFSGYAQSYGYQPGDVVGQDPAEAFKPQRTVTRTGKTKDGRKVVQYSDGSIEYGN